MRQPEPIRCVCHGDGDQLSLIHIACAPKKKHKPTPGVRYARYKPKVHTVCGDCIADIHQLGVAVAPLPRPVRWRRSDADGALPLCEAHKEHRQEVESREC